MPTGPQVPWLLRCQTAVCIHATTGPCFSPLLTPNTRPLPAMALVSQAAGTFFTTFYQDIVIPKVQVFKINIIFFNNITVKGVNFIIAIPRIETLFTNSTSVNIQINNHRNKWKHLTYMS